MYRLCLVVATSAEKNTSVNEHQWWNELKDKKLNQYRFNMKLHIFWKSKNNLYLRITAILIPQFNSNEHSVPVQEEVRALCNKDEQRRDLNHTIVSCSQ